MHRWHANLCDRSNEININYNKGEDVGIEPTNYEKLSSLAIFHVFKFLKGLCTHQPYGAYLIKKKGGIYTWLWNSYKNVTKLF